MSKSRLIPTTENPWKCEINGISYCYKAGTTQTVPDEVAELIDHINDAKPKEAIEPGHEGQVFKRDAKGNGVWADDYTLPTASASVKGGVKVGSGLAVTSDGTLSTNGGNMYMHKISMYTTVGGATVDIGFDVYSSSSTAFTTWGGMIDGITTSLESGSIHFTTYIPGVSDYKFKLVEFEIKLCKHSTAYNLFYTVMTYNTDGTISGPSTSSSFFDDDKAITDNVIG